MILLHMTLAQAQAMWHYLSLPCAFELVFAINEG